MAGARVIASWAKPNGSRLRLYEDGRLVGEVHGRRVTIRQRPVELPTFWTLAQAEQRAAKYGFERLS